MPLHERYHIAASCRASFFGYNRPEEVDRLVEGLREAMIRFRDGKRSARQRTEKKPFDEGRAS
jgi:hypothetical protein